MPDGARHVATHYDWHTDSILLTFEHESFDDVPQGGEIPFVREPSFESRCDDGADHENHNWRADWPNGTVDTPVTVGG